MQSLPQAPGLELALVQLPGRMRRALRSFSKITGLTAVTSLATSLPESGTPSALSPPVHPRCARRLRGVRAAPCREQWLTHVRSGRRSPNVISHTCPIGLRCSCVPIRFDTRLLGVAKLVVDCETSDAAFRTATSVLEVVVSGTCQDSLVSVLSQELGTLRQSMERLQQIRSKDEPLSSGPEQPVTAPSTGKAGAGNGTLVKQTLAYLQRHYQEPNLSLPGVAKALRCNPTYLTSCFTQNAGEHMHRYLIGLRVAHACQLLMGTDLPIKEVAYASGILGPASLARAFRRHVGVSPHEYRRIFAAT